SACFALCAVGQPLDIRVIRRFNMNFRFWSNEKTLRMAWRVKKDGVVSCLVGTAHFFPHSFRRSLTNFMRNVATVMFEGPLDEASSARIAEYGRNGDGVPAFVDELTPEAINKIDRILRNRLDTQNGDAWLLSLVERRPIYFEAFTNGLRPFAAFFSIWQTYLDWKYSVDMEGYQVARKLGKEIHFLETLDEQLKVLDNISPERIVRNLNDVGNWDEFKKQYVAYYLDGDLDNMVGLTGRFVTRGPIVVSARDQILFDRMKPIFERKNAVAFIGFPHIPGVTKLFRDEGYTITQVLE
ncbi:TraB/GumN family protein, partial [Chloroflexota bacterium]